MAKSARGILRPLNLESVPGEGLPLTLMAEAISKTPEPSGMTDGMQRLFSQRASCSWCLQGHLLLVPQPQSERHSP